MFRFLRGSGRIKGKLVKAQNIEAAPQFLKIFFPMTALLLP
jgi:hypothetical protein